MAKYLDKIGLSYFWSLIKSKLIPAGGQQGQVLAKASAADDDVTWVSTGVNNLIGDNLVAASNRQLVIGQYNEADQDENAIIVGNGTDETDRQNVLTVGRDGRIDTEGPIQSTWTNNDHWAVFIHNDQDTDLTQSDNGVSQRFSRYLMFQDKNSSPYAWFNGTIDPSGKTGLGITCRNCNGSNTYNNGLWLDIDKSGTIGVSVSSPLAWRNAIDAQATLSVTTGTVTRGTAASSWSSADLRKYGHVVTLNLNTVKLASAIASGSTSGTIATVPAGFRPSSAFRFSVPMSTTSNRANVWGVVGTGGVIQIANRSDYSIPAGTEVHICVTYIVS